jgi:hypothetical protein
VAINEVELMFIGLFRVALSVPTHEERLAAIRCVRHEVTASRLHEINRKPGPDWVHDENNRELIAWLAATAGEREDAIYEFSRVCQAYDDRYERPLNVAEQVGKMVCTSIDDGKFDGVQTKDGILYQVGVQGREHSIRGSKDKDSIRKAWRDYRGVVHLGMALDFCEQLRAPFENVFFVAEWYRRMLSESCPKGTKKPYVNAEQQFSFLYESSIYGPRFLNRGLPFTVKD